MIVLILIYYFINSQKVLGRNIKGLYVKVTINEQPMTISPVDVCHGNADYFECKNVSLTYLLWMDCNLLLLQVSCSILKHLKSSYLL